MKNPLDSQLQAVINLNGVSLKGNAIKREIPVVKDAGSVQKETMRLLSMRELSLMISP